MDQPYGAFAKTLLEVQRYPNLRDAAGHPIAPYDVTAHTLPLLMGVTVHPVKAPFAYSRPTDQHEMYGRAKCESLRVLTYSRSTSLQFPLTTKVGPDGSSIRRTFRMACLATRNCEPASRVHKPSAGVTIKYYVILIPDQPARTLLEGYRDGAMPPEYTGGLGPEGVRHLREFVETGGTLVFLNRASNFAIEQFKLPVRNVVAGLPRTEFYVPGSILAH